MANQLARTGLEIVAEPGINLIAPLVGRPQISGLRRTARRQRKLLSTPAERLASPFS